MKFKFPGNDVSFVEDGEGEEELVFRQDDAWKKSMRKSPPLQNTIKYKEEIKDLRQTIDSMRNSRNSEKLMINVSERSRDFEAFFPSFTPTFLGNFISDNDLDKILSEFTRKSKKKKKKKTLQKAESEVTLTGDTVLSESNLTENIFISEQNPEIIHVLDKYQNDLDLSMVCVKDSKCEEWSVETKTRFHGLLLARDESSVIQCITVRVHVLEEFRKVLNKNVGIYGICYRENICVELAKLLTPFSVDDIRWLGSIWEIQQSKGWISILLDLDEQTFKELTDIIYSQELLDKVLFPTAVAQNLRHTSCLFDEKVALEFLPIKEDEMAYNSNVVCIINCSAFIDLGDILSLTQKEGFYLTGMHTIRIDKTHIIDMFSKSISDQDYSLIIKKAMKIFCHGPSIALSFHRHRARVTLNSLLESKYEKSLDEQTIFSETIISPVDECMSDNWTKIFFPHGPISEIKHALIGNQLIYKSVPLYFHTTGRTDPPAHHGNYDFFTVTFLSISNLTSENLAAWGDILSKILRLKSANVHIRIEKCDLVNCSAKVAREIASGCDLDPLETLRLIHRKWVLPHDALKHYTSIIQQASGVECSSESPCFLCSSAAWAV